MQYSGFMDDGDDDNGNLSAYFVPTSASSFSLLAHERVTAQLVLNTENQTKLNHINWLKSCSFVCGTFSVRLDGTAVAVCVAPTRIFIAPEDKLHSYSTHSSV